MEESFHVCVRSKPLIVVTSGDYDGSVPPTPRSAVRCLLEEGVVQVSVPAPGGRLHIRDFPFEASFDDSCSQEEVFRRSGVVDIVESAFSGLRNCVLAYGATGSGKTFHHVRSR